MGVDSGENRVTSVYDRLMVAGNTRRVYIGLLVNGLVISNELGMGRKIEVWYSILLRTIKNIMFKSRHLYLYSYWILQHILYIGAYIHSNNRLV